MKIILHFVGVLAALTIYSYIKPAHAQHNNYQYQPGQYYNQPYNQPVRPQRSISKYKNPLVDAADAGDMGRVQQLLRAGQPVDSKGMYDTTALMRAAYNGNMQMAQTLLAAGADPNSVDILNLTPLRMAADNNHMQMADLLLRNGADRRYLTREQYARIMEMQKHRVPVARQQPQQRHNEFLRQQQKKYKRFEPSAGPAAPAATSAGLFSTKTMLIAGGVAAAGGIAVAASGGGGGGGDSTPAVTPPDFTPPSGTPADFETVEYNNQQGLAQMNSSNAYANGSAGLGTIVAVLDSGVDIDHPDLVANIVDGGVDYIDNDPDASPEEQGFGRSHGTHVAGIIAATKNNSGMHGVAYQSGILPLRIGTSAGFVFGTQFTPAAFNYAADNGARVLNNSWGSVFFDINDFPDEASLVSFFGADVINAYKTTVARDVAVVWAAGNDSHTETTVNSAVPLRIPELRDLWVVVVAVNESNGIASFSNHCGLSRDWCIAAPGTNIISTYDMQDEFDTGDDGYEAESGTSMAAPHVSGAIAVLLTKFPGLTTAQAIDILFDTATDLGTAGVDSVYGHGLVNLEAATAPQGSMSIPVGSNVNGASAGFGDSQISMGSAFGDALASAGLQVAVLDKYKRAYAIDLSNIVSRQEIINPADSLAKFGEKEFDKSVRIGNSASLSYSETVERQDELPKYGRENERKLEKAKFSADYGNTNMAMSYNTSPEELMGFTAVERDSATIAKDVMSNPYLGLVEDGIASAVSRKDKNITYKFGAFHGSQDDEDNINNSSYSGNDTKTSGAVGEITGKVSDTASVSVQAGVISEENSFLGSRTSGAFASGENIPTYFAGIAVESSLTDNVKIRGSYTAGYSIPTTSSNSLLNDISTIRSESASVGISYSGLLRRGSASNPDRLSFNISQPLRVSSGHAFLTLPFARDAAGNLLINSNRANLAPTGREIDLELSYMLPLAEETSLTTGALYRIEPNHIKEASPETLLLMKLNHSF